MFENKEIHEFLLKKIKHEAFYWVLGETYLLIWSGYHKAVFSKKFESDLNKVCSFPIIEKGNNYMYLDCYGAGGRSLSPSEIQAMMI